MGSSVLIPAAHAVHENADPLLYLPCSTIVQHRRADMIYGSDDPCTHVYLVIAGLVQVSRSGREQHPVIVDVYRADEFFGEGALVRLPQRGEQAIALEKTMLMSWAAADVERLMDRKPALAMAFVKMMVARQGELADRVESLSRDNVAVRLARALLRFAYRFGTPAPVGTVCMRAFTHHFLAQYIGTSRELVNVAMTQFRRLQLLEYSRKGITLWCDALSQWVQNNQ